MPTIYDSEYIFAIIGATRLSTRSPGEEDYDITNVRLGARNDDSGLDIALYVNNVFDIQGDVFLVGATATPTVKYTNLPRTIGVELSKRFQRISYAFLR
ncbi:MAG: hypothetical protein ACREV5_10635 [Steroidobacter sp.]